MTKTTIADLAIQNKMGYQRTRECALRGQFGEVIREGGRLFVVVAETSTATKRDAE